MVYNLHHKVRKELEMRGVEATWQEGNEFEFFDKETSDKLFDIAAQNQGFENFEATAKDLTKEKNMHGEKITPASYNKWLAENNPKSVSIVCTDGYGDTELAKAIKNHNSSANIHLFEPGNFLKEDAPAFDFIMFGYDLADQDLSKLKHGEFVVR